MAGYLDPNDEMVQAFSKLGTTPVSDAMDRLGLGGQVFGVKPVDRNFQLCGRARGVPVLRGSTGTFEPGDYSST